MANSARRHAARRLQAQLDIPYTLALRIADAEHAATMSDHGSADADGIDQLSPRTQRALTAAINDWLAANLLTNALERAGGLLHE